MDSNSSATNSSMLWRTIILVGLQFPVVAAWIGYFQTNREYLAVVTIFTVVYEIAVFALTFGKKVWAELEKDAVNATADWVREYVRCFSPGFRNRYKKFLIEEHGNFNVRGLGLINTYRLKLDKVFVELRVDPSNPQKFSHNPIAQRQLTGNRPIWDFLRLGKEIKGEAFALSIVGPPGCGKTTLLQNIVLTFAGNRQSNHNLRAYTPILIFLRDHAQDIVQNKPNLHELVQEHFSNKKQFSTLETPPKWFENELKNGRCLVLLDGLDEVGDVEQRKIASEWVDNQIKSYPRCRFVLTARPQGYHDAPLERADIVLEVLPFNVGQVRRFIESWYLANEVVASGNRLDDRVRRSATKEANDLLERLSKNASINALTVNPLLLTMIAMVHRYHGALPGSRIELYNEICHVLLGRWRQARGIRDKLTANQKLVVLRPLAAYMMENRRRDVTLDEAFQSIEEPLNSVGVTGNEAKLFPAEMQASSGLLLEREEGKWSFAHLTFQEFLTAAHWLEQRFQPNWKQLAGESWWRETLRLYAAQGDATNLVKACLQTDTVEALSLAVDCLEESRQLLPEMRKQTEARLIEALESNNGKRRQIAAKVQLSRRLRHSFQRIDDNREIDTEFVSHAEYQLFLDDMLAQGKFLQPNHWTNYDFAKAVGKEEAKKPIRGVEISDAIKFCEWLTQTTGGEWQYRLPTSDEIKDLVIEVKDLIILCEGDNVYSSVIYSINSEAEEKKKISEDLIKDMFIEFADLPTLDVKLDFSLPNLHDDFDRALNRDLTYDRTLNFHLGANSSRNIVVDTISALVLDRTLKRVRDDYLTHAIRRALDLELNMPDARWSVFEPVRNLIITRNYYGNTYANVEKFLRGKSSAFEKRTASLILELLKIMTSSNDLEARVFWRRYYAKLFAAACLGASICAKEKTTSWKSWFWLSDNHNLWEQLAKDYGNTYLFFQILVARDEGSLPARESIWLVREKVSDFHQSKI